MASEIPTWLSTLGFDTWRSCWSLVKIEPQWMVGMALTATHKMMKTTSPTINRPAETTNTATTRSVATCRSITCAVLNQVRTTKTRYQHRKNPKAPDSKVSW